MGGSGLKLSIVIPAHNEAGSIERTLVDVTAALDLEAIDFELLVVDDASTDETAAIVERLGESDPRVVYLRSEYPRGFGFTVRYGLDSFTGDAVAVVMADGSDSPLDLVTYCRLLESGYDCAFGSRFVRGAKVNDYPWVKLVLNRAANFVIRLLFQHGYNDTTNAFKAYRREVIDTVRPLLSNHFNLTVELPLKAIARGHSYAVVPISWTNRQDGVSKLKIQEMGSRYLFIVLYVFLEHHLSRGDYHRSTGEKAPRLLPDARSRSLERGSEPTAISTPAPPTDRGPAALAGNAEATVVALLAFLAASVLYVAGRGLSFFFDEWNFVLERRGESASTYLLPHNGHLSIVPISIYKALFALVGLHHYGPYRLAAIAAHIVCAVLLYLLLRRRAPRMLALLALFVFLFLGRAWMDLIWPFQLGYLGAVAGGLGSLYFVDRDFGRRGDVALCLLLTLSLASSGVGIPFWVGTAAAFALRRRNPRRVWSLVVPIGLYLLWYQHYGSNDALTSNIPKLPRYVFDSFAAAAGSLAGLPFGPSRYFGVVALIAILCAFAVRRRAVIGALVPAVAVLAFWVLTGLTRAQYNEPGASRYLYPGAALLLLLAAELVSGVVVARWIPVLLLPLALLSVVANLHTLRDGARSMRGWDASADASLAVLELDRSLAPPNFQPSPHYAPQVTAAAYFAATRELGSPALPASILTAQAPAVRLDADSTFARLVLPRALTRGARAAATQGPQPEGFGGGRLESRGGCLVFAPNKGQVPPAVDLEVPRHGLTLQSSKRVSLFLRRLGDFPTEATTTFGPGAFLLRLPGDALGVPWHVRLSPSATLTACALR